MYMRMWSKFEPMCMLLHVLSVLIQCYRLASRHILIVLSSRIQYNTWLAHSGLMACNLYSSYLNAYQCWLIYLTCRFSSCRQRQSCMCYNICISDTCVAISTYNSHSIMQKDNSECHQQKLYRQTILLIGPSQAACATVLVL